MNQRSIVFQDPSSVVDHPFDDLLGRENLVYLSGDATGEPWSGTEKIFWVLLEVFLDWHDALIEESFGFGLTVVLPE